MSDIDPGLALDAARWRVSLAREAHGLVTPGAVLRLGPGDWRYHGVDDGDLILRVERIRDDLSRYYDGEVWVQGDRLDADGAVVGPFQALVRMDALQRSRTA